MCLNCGVGVILRFPWTGRKSNKSTLKEISPDWIFIGRIDADAETPIVWPPDVKNWLTGKDPDARKDWRQEEKGMTEDEMIGWHHQLNGLEFEQASGAGDGQGSLACCSVGSQRVGHDWATELNWTTIFQFVTVFLVGSVSFWLYLRLSSLFLHYSFIIALSPFSIRALSTIIIVVLNS